MCMFNRNCLTTKLTMISKELLTAIRKDEHKVLNTDLNYIEKDNKIGYLLDNRQWYFINIYEFAHKCKEWAVNLSPNKHALSSYPRWGDIRNYKKTNGSYYICQHLVSGVQFEAETEPEAIFRACEWILEQIEKK